LKKFTDDIDPLKDDTFTDVLTVMTVHNVSNAL